MLFFHCLSVKEGMALHNVVGFFVLSIELILVALNEIKQLSQNFVQRSRVVVYSFFFISHCYFS